MFDRLKKYPRLMPMIVLLTLMAPKLFAVSGNSAVAVQHLLLGLVLIIFVAKLGGDLFVRMGQPAVLGELIFGIIIGNLGIFDIHLFDFMAKDSNIEILSELGIIFLLFQVGLETDINKMAKVGLSAFLVATVGVIVPFLLGWLVAFLFIKEEGMYAQMFIGASLCATSVGLTARVLMDLGKLHTKEARVILGAAVIDDVQGIIVLTVIAGLIHAAGNGNGLSALSIIIIIAKALVFLGLVLVFGRTVVRKTFSLTAKLKSDHIMLAVAVVFCFGLAAAASYIGLAPIVGAFAAGLILNEAEWEHVEKFKGKSVEKLIEPIAGFLVPIFFVRMGATVDVRTFGDYNVLIFAAVLILAAIIGKQVCGLGVLDKSINKVIIGIGMIPRGEVGLIFASIGSTLMLNGMRVITDKVYSAIVIMVVITTIVTPPLLKMAIARYQLSDDEGRKGIEKLNED